MTHQAKFLPEQIVVIRDLYAARELTLDQLASEFITSRNVISNIVRGETYRGCDGEATYDRMRVSKIHDGFSARVHVALSDERVVEVFWELILEALSRGIVKPHLDIRFDRETRRLLLDYREVHNKMADGPRNIARRLPAFGLVKRALTIAEVEPYADKQMRGKIKRVMSLAHSEENAWVVSFLCRGRRKRGEYGMVDSEPIIPASEVATVIARKERRERECAECWHRQLAVKYAVGRPRNKPAWCRSCARRREIRRRLRGALVRYRVCSICGCPALTDTSGFLAQLSDGRGVLCPCCYENTNTMLTKAESAACVTTRYILYNLAGIAFDPCQESVEETEETEEEL